MSCVYFSVLTSIAEAVIGFADWSTLKGAFLMTVYHQRMMGLYTGKALAAEVELGCTPNVGRLGAAMTRESRDRVVVGVVDHQREHPKHWISCQHCQGQSSLSSAPPFLIVALT